MVVAIAIYIANELVIFDVSEYRLTDTTQLYD